MKINSLTIEYAGEKKKFEFFSNFNLIHSKSNSVGKSTLLRLLFYSLGYNIPGTKKIKFKNSIVTCNFIINNKIMETERKDNIIDININNEFKDTYVLPHDEIKIHSLIWNTEDVFILQNLLGAIYMDQEKGWTLLNRGTVIGSVKFNIEELIQGLSNRVFIDLNTRKENLKAELKRYNQLKNIIVYKQHLVQIENDYTVPNYPTKLENQIQILNFEKNEIQADLKSIDNVIENNADFLKFIEKMKLAVYDKNNDIVIPVNKSTILNFDDNQLLLETRRKMMKIKLAQINKNIRTLEEEMNMANNLFELQSEIERFDSHIINLRVDPEQIERIIKQLKNELTDLNELIRKKTIQNNKIIGDLQRTILKYANELGILDSIDIKKDYIFTSDLKSLSGAVFHKLVFSFKMAYILEIQKVLGFKLPIVLDSPSGREVDEKNIESTMNILLNDFSENQIIIASIYQYENLKPLHKIEINSRLLE